MKRKWKNFCWVKILIVSSSSVTKKISFNVFLWNVSLKLSLQKKISNKKNGWKLSKISRDKNKFLRIFFQVKFLKKAFSYFFLCDSFQSKKKYFTNTSQLSISPLLLQIFFEFSMFKKLDFITRFEKISQRNFFLIN